MLKYPGPSFQAAEAPGKRGGGPAESKHHEPPLAPSLKECAISPTRKTREGLLQAWCPQQPRNQIPLSLCAAILCASASFLVQAPSGRQDSGSSRSQRHKQQYPGWEKSYLLRFKHACGSLAGKNLSHWPEPSHMLTAQPITGKQVELLGPESTQLRTWYTQRLASEQTWGSFRKEENGWMWRMLN